MKILNRQDRIPYGRCRGILEVERREIELPLADAAHQLDACYRGRGASKRSQRAIQKRLQCRSSGLRLVDLAGSSRTLSCVAWKHYEVLVTCLSHAPGATPMLPLKRRLK
jgi:hypothetical protein